jgi:hypothetical protein
MKSIAIVDDSNVKMRDWYVNLCEELSVEKQTAAIDRS